MSDRERAKDLAAGKWPSILPMLGVPANYLDKKHHRCPANGEGEDRFRFADRNGSGSFFCNCSRGDKGGIALVMCCKGIGYAEACREIEKVAGAAVATPPSVPVDGRQRVAKYAAKARPIEAGDAVAQYLAGRGLKLPPQGIAKATLDYFERGERGPKGTYTAMVASMRGKDGKTQTLHVTYLEGGKKAPVSAPRKLVSSGYEPGSAIRLFPVAEHLGVAEGIETALAAAELFDLPTWALVNEGNMRKFRPPPGVTRVSVFGDKDDNYAGQAAAYSLANDLERDGIACDVYLPTQPGKCDWNDVLLMQQGKA
ncbi:toprim domain-containing protein [Xanthomonas rydalmerensis]|uniref:Toprim domain-containing protein n=1 Tax=Xanthomonas rydalmerensis TaxID=3046274 RepID=A0ABZ0JNS3_9XANT|nr:toprim domain-containing protein [Xanthomonas sp. DM-2023]WOS40695.1 toprim domain-containing protein [Xanthomonas sp. DM-2023]WOS44879.1 toprim domain-containing protein [Xanthomonas sp. DM-2023]WOS49059.1 toprim domain-containing protein [Xanthomonas sp. DM-2023]WOS53239.1 toprim domain-containing protein [Xanthomonas sp. DM-2023]WOS57422.1 toprim domain-containing protein [Xanthomonas sp. DM-2023]